MDINTDGQFGHACVLSQPTEISPAVAVFIWARNGDVHTIRQRINREGKKPARLKEA